MKHKDDNFKTEQSYILSKSVEQCRMAFRIRCEMVDEIKGNFKDKYRRRGERTRLSSVMIIPARKSKPRIIALSVQSGRR